MPRAREAMKMPAGIFLNEFILVKIVQVLVTDS
jgi:hypothetical protein